MCRTFFFSVHQQEILELIKDFYSALYNDSIEQATNDSTKKIDVPKVLSADVQQAMRNLRNGKAAGRDRITAEILKACGDETYKVLADLFTPCLKERNISTSWKNPKITILHKEGYQKDLKNYRLISLLWTIYKLLTKIITKQLETALDHTQATEQAGFRSGYRTMDKMQVVQVIERCAEYGILLCFTSINFEKAFDSIKLKTIFVALRREGVEEPYINLLEEIYTDTTATFHINNNTVKIDIKKA